MESGTCGSYRPPKLGLWQPAPTTPWNGSLAFWTPLKLQLQPGPHRAGGVLRYQRSSPERCRGSTPCIQVRPQSPGLGSAGLRVLEQAPAGCQGGGSRGVLVGISPPRGLLGEQVSPGSHRAGDKHQGTGAGARVRGPLGLEARGAGAHTQSRGWARPGGLEPVVGVQVVNHRLDEVRGGGVTAHVPGPDLEGEGQRGENGGVSGGTEASGRGQESRGEHRTGSKADPWCTALPGEERLESCSRHEAEPG